MYRTIGSLLFFAALASTPVAAANEPLVLAPSSKWTAHYRPDSCRLMRSFGTDKETVFLVINRYHPTDYFQMTVAGAPMVRFNSQTKAKVQFGPDEAVQEQSYHEGALGEYKAIIFMQEFTVDQRDEQPPTEDAFQGSRPESTALSKERLAAIKTLTLQRAGRSPIQLEIGSMDKPFAALSTCIDDLLTGWGIDPAKDKLKRNSPIPLSPPGSWVVSSDYPKGMLWKGQPAIVNFRLMIDEKGGVSSCHIQETTFPKAYDYAVCGSNMRRGKFSPALDADGNPMKSYWRNRVRFQIPG